MSKTLKKGDTDYRPCKKCGSTEYDNADQKAWDHTEDGRLIVEPDECDQCNFELMLSESDLIH